MFTRPLRDRFMEKFIVVESGCWEWTSTILDDGYGAIWLNRKNVRAHRVSFELFKGEIPQGMFICHTCDNRKCINPDHLFAGTAKDNLVDMGRKGRQRLQVNRHLTQGENNNQAKLTTAKVVEIKKRLRNGENQSALGREFGVKQDTINKIARGRAWTHVA